MAENTLLALDTSRVRVAPRLLSPLPQTTDADTFRVMIVGAASRDEAEENAKEIKKIANEEAQVAFDAETKTWGLIVGAKQPREESRRTTRPFRGSRIDATVEGATTPVTESKPNTAATPVTQSNQRSSRFPHY